MEAFANNHLYLLRIVIGYRSIFSFRGAVITYVAGNTSPVRQLQEVPHSGSPCAARVPLSLGNPYIMGNTIRIAVGITCNIRVDNALIIILPPGKEQAFHHLLGFGSAIGK